MIRVNSTSEKKLFIKSYGCQMNVYDADRMADILAPEGCILSDNVMDADIIILNTCHIREKATEKIYSELGRLAIQKAKREKVGKQTVLAVGGCVGQAEGSEIIRRAPYVDIVFGPQTYHRLPEMLKRANAGFEKVIETDFPIESKFDSFPEATIGKPYSAFITVQEGCDKFCTFCVVPYTRGSEYSRPAPQIVAEAQSLAKKGVREVTLLGQNVNNYHGYNKGCIEKGLGSLIENIAKIDGLSRIRYTTSYPADLNMELINAHRNVKELMPFLHLPLQSGSNSVLRAMNRRHNVEDYYRLVEKLRIARPDIALSSDFIVGFPGETDKDFEETLKVIKDINFVNAYSFKYSPRPGTPAATMDFQVPEQEKIERLERLQKLLGVQQIQFNQSCVGMVMPVLLEGEGRKAGQLVGRSPFMQPVNTIASKDFVGQIMNIKIDSAQKYSLRGQII